MVKLPFNPNTLSAEDKSVYEETLAKRKKQGSPFGGPYIALMNHPKLCQKVEALGFYLKFEGSLPRNIYQFVVLAVARETHADFEWKDHIKHALDAGVPLEVTKVLKTHGVNHSFPEPYRLAAEILRATLVWKSIPAKIQAEAINQFGMLGFLEIVVLSGFYQMFSAINQGFDIANLSSNS